MSRKEQCRGRTRIRKEGRQKMKTRKMLKFLQEASLGHLGLVKKYQGHC